MASPIHIGAHITALQNAQAAKPVVARNATPQPAPTLEQKPVAKTKASPVLVGSNDSNLPRGSIVDFLA